MQLIKALSKSSMAYLLLVNKSKEQDSEADKEEAPEWLKDMLEEFKDIQSNDKFPNKPTGRLVGQHAIP